MIRKARGRITCLVALAVLALAACSGENQPDSPEDDSAEIKTYGETTSPDGEVRARVYHYDSPNGGLTQVSLDFVDRGCGSGSAAWHDYDLGIELRWLDNETLEVLYPAGKRYSHNASGDYLVCYNRGARVVMVPRSGTSDSSPTYSPVVKSNPVSAGASNINAYTLTYDAPHGGVTQAIVEFEGKRGCKNSLLTIYRANAEVGFRWISSSKLEVSYPENAAISRLSDKPYAFCSPVKVDIVYNTVVSDQ